MNLLEKGIANSFSFVKLNEDEIKLIAEKSYKINFKEGDLIVREGERNNNLYILLKGSAKVITHLEKYEIFLSVVRPYSIIGEISFIDNEEISADIVAQELCVVACIPHSELKNIMENSPVITAKIWANLSLLLAKRVRKSNEMMRNYFGINKALCENEEFRKFFSYCYYSSKE